MAEATNGLQDALHTEAPSPPAPLAAHGRSLRRTPLWTLKALQFLDTAAWACLGRFISVFYSEIGVSRERIGLLQFLGLIASFFGQLLWSSLIDRRGEYACTMVATTTVGSLVAFLFLLESVQSSFALLLMTSLLFNFLCTGGPIIDALCLTVLSSNTEEDYGDQRLWCAIGWGGMSLLAGQLIDVFGLPFMFYGFAGIQAVNVAIILGFVRAQPAHAAEDSGGIFVGQGKADVVWFLLNVLQYGVAMSLVENFLLLFLLQDFDNTPKVLLGASVAVMCACEVPVFKYFGKLLERWRLPNVLAGCQAVLALRLLLYVALPASSPWLVLLIEPLHGVTFAAMWVATVEYGQRTAPPGATARMQALINGVYEKGAMGLGSVVWGKAIARPPVGLGFPRCFVIDAGLVLLWSGLWRAGYELIARRAARTGEAR